MKKLLAVLAALLLWNPLNADPGAKSKQSPSQLPTNPKVGDRISRTAAKIDLVWVPPGEALLGSPNTEEGRSGKIEMYPDQAQRPVTFREGFWIGRYEITQQQWVRVLGAGGAIVLCDPSNSREDSKEITAPNKPIYCISWQQAQKFISKLNEQDSALGYRLPTEEEWEYGARAGSTTPFAFGESLSSLEANIDGLWPYPKSASRSPSLSHLTAVGSYRPNAWGIYDMHGNVYEWTSSEDGNSRIVRGGSFAHDGRSARSSNRFGFYADDRKSFLGFRVVGQTKR